MYHKENQQTMLNLHSVENKCYIVSLHEIFVNLTYLIQTRLTYIVYLTTREFIFKSKQEIQIWI